MTPSFPFHQYSACRRTCFLLLPLYPPAPAGISLPFFIWRSCVKKKTHQTKASCILKKRSVCCRYFRMLYPSGLWRRGAGISHPQQIISDCNGTHCHDPGTPSDRTDSHQMAVPGKRVNLERSRRGDYIGAFLLGLTFSFGWTPCIGPVLGAILGLSATSSRPLYGALLMAVYSLGFLIPFLALSLFSDVLLAKVTRLHRHLGKIKTAGGVIIILMGFLLMTDHLGSILTVFV